MGAAKKANGTTPMLNNAETGSAVYDPLLQKLQTPREMWQADWKAVAGVYLDVARNYAAKNDRYIDELTAAKDDARQRRIEGLERSLELQDELHRQIKQRDGEIAQYKAMIHLLTKGRG